nr:hypothetical protein [uncultured Acinetobacter sp.]
MLTETFTFDLSKIPLEVLEGLNNGTMNQYEGVVYWAAGSGKTGAVIHLPIKLTQLVTEESFLSVMNGLQNTIVAAQALATGTLMVAMAIQTQVLANKIENVQKVVVQIADSVKEQSLVFYADKASEYLALLHNFGFLLQKHVDLNKILPIANNTLSTSLQLKKHLIFFIKSLIGLIEDKKINDKYHVINIINFVQQILEILPLGMHFEFLLSQRLGQNEFSQVLLEDSSKIYQTLLNQYRNFLNETDRAINEYRIKKEDVPFLKNIENQAIALFKSPIIPELLERPVDIKQLSLLKRKDFYQVNLSA